MSFADKPSGRRSVLVIDTPEGVTFSYQLATPFLRMLAWAVDAAAIAAASDAVGTIFRDLGKLSPDWANGIAAVSFFAIQIGYGMALEWRWRGQTLGKRIFGLRVVDVQGLRLEFSQIALRNLLRLVDLLPALYLVGGIAAFASRNAQRLGDLAANTVVARERAGHIPKLERIAPVRYNSLAAYPHLAARLRARANAEAVGVLTRALELRDGYDPPARVALYAELADYFRGLVEFPPAALEGLTDEQYLRGVLRVLFT
ncbi:MAG: RDD family protein [Bryobacteraceae bacterium]